MRIARFSLNDKPRYAFVQQDPADGKDYLIELDGYPFGAAPVKPTGERYALDADGLRLLAPVIPSKCTVSPRTTRRTRSSCTRAGTPRLLTRRKTW